jgi:putative ABC transport system ATP-binding protein
MNSHLIVAEELRKSYDHGRVRALDGVSLALGRGEFLSIVGPSGSGKSTLLHILGALDRPDEGRVLLDGKDLAEEPRLDRVRARSIGFVFQLHNLVPTLTAAENVALPLYSLGVRARERRARAMTRLEGVGLADRAGHRPDELSGGERQRVAIARALVNEPKLILADEPTGNLDQTTGTQIIDLLRGLQSHRDLTLVLVTHDPQIALKAGRTVQMVDGRLIESPGGRGA